MKKQDIIENPLFNKLLERAQNYQPIYGKLNEQENTGTADTKEESNDFQTILGDIILGAYLLMNSAVKNFPEGNHKGGFLGNIKTMGLSSDPSPEAAMNKISKMLEDFINGAKNDPGMKGLEEAYKDYQTSMNLYKQSLEELKKQEPDKIASQDAKDFLKSKLGSQPENKVSESLSINESLEDRRSKRFTEKGNLVAFINNCKTLASQIQSKIDQIELYKKASPDLKTPGSYGDKYTQLLNRINELIKDARVTRKNDGKKIEGDLKNEYNVLYAGIKKDFEDSSLNFDKKLKNERIDRLKKSKYTKATEILSKAVEAKNNGDSKIIAKHIEKKSEQTEKKEKTGSIEVKEPIKRSAVRGKKNTDVEAFQKLVLDKFKNVKEVGDSEIFKKFQGYGADGLFGNTTAGMVQGLKAGFGLNDTTSDITQELINKINTEGLKESKFPIVKFSEFGKNNAAIYEKFDIDAFNKTIEKGKKEDPNYIKPKRSEIASSAKSLGTDKKISSEDIKKTVDDSVNKVKGDFKREEIIKELVKIKGVKKEEKYDGVKVQAIAVSPGMRFYENNVALRVWNKILGSYDLTKDEFKGDDGSIDKISVIASGVTPSKYTKKAQQLSLDIYGINPRNKKLYNELLNWKTDEIKLLAKVYKAQLARVNKSGNLFDDLADEWTNTEEIKKLLKKFGTNLE